jgi:hypothetical protein
MELVSLVLHPPHKRVCVCVSGMLLLTVFKKSNVQYTVAVVSSGKMFVPGSVKTCCWFKSLNGHTT